VFSGEKLGLGVYGSVVRWVVTKKIVIGSPPLGSGRCGVFGGRPSRMAAAAVPECRPGLRDEAVRAAVRDAAQFSGDLSDGRAVVVPLPHGREQRGRAWLAG
jgi:hypothetical protein